VIGHYIEIDPSLSTTG